MRTIWKFPLEVTDQQTVMMPAGASIISVGNQDGGLVMWAKVDTDQEPEPVSIVIRGTGHPIEQDDEHYEFLLNSVQVPPFVWHVFHQIPRHIADEAHGAKPRDAVLTEG